MKPFFSGILFLLPFLPVAQVVRQPLSIKYAGLSAYSKHFPDIFSGAANQAAFAQIKSGGLGMFGERRFLIPDLNQFCTIVALPTSSGTFALQADYFGFSSFNENQIGLAYARTITKQVDVGVKFNHHSIQAAGYGNASAVNFEAGAIFHLTENVHTGFHVYNPFSSKLGKNRNEQLGSIYKAGLGYEPSKQVLISTEIVKQEDVPVSVIAGLQYNIHEQINLRCGISTGTNDIFFGMGLLLGLASININSSYHPQLGFTPGVSILINFKKPEKQ